MLTTEDVKIMLEVQQKAYKEGMDFLLKDLTAILGQLEERNNDLVQSLEFNQSEVDVIKDQNKSLRKDICFMKCEFCKATDIVLKINRLTERVDYQEDYSRRDNLRFDRLPEQPSETWEVTQHKVQRLLSDKLESNSTRWCSRGHIEMEFGHLRGLRGLARWLLALPGSRIASLCFGILQNLRTLIST